MRRETEWRRGMTVTIVKKLPTVGAATPTESHDDYESHQANFNTEISQTLTTSKQEAIKFLSILAPGENNFSFQTFDDNADRKNENLSGISHGSISEHWNELDALNQQGAGVFVTVNRTDLKGRKKANIIRVRAIWQEADNGDEPTLPCLPHIEVESSPGKFHRYVLTDGPEVNCLDEFESVQQRMVDNYGSDPNAKDRSRVLRLPGFFHQKINSKKNLVGTPHLVRVVSSSSLRPYSWDELKKKFPPVEKKENKRLKHIIPKRQKNDFVLGLYDQILGALQYLNPDCEYEDWLKIGMALHNSDPNQSGLEIWIGWSRGGIKYNEGECWEKWKTFNNENVGDMNKLITVGTIFHMGKQAGWDGHPIIYSEEALNKQILKLDEVDIDEAQEIYHRISLSKISKSKKTKLHGQVCFKTGENQKYFNDSIKKIQSRKPTQLEIINIFISLIGFENLINVKSFFYLYKKGCWLPQDVSLMRKEIQTVCDGRQFSYTKPAIDGVIGLLSAKVSKDICIFDNKYDQINCINGEIGIDNNNGAPILKQSC